MLRTITLSAALFMGATCLSSAQNFENWSVTSDNGACWAYTHAQASEGTMPNRNSGKLSIQNEPSQDVKGSIIASNGGIDATQLQAEFNVDGKKFEALTYRDAAFVASGKPEAELTAAMTRGAVLLVSWNNSEGDPVALDSYSLSGFSAAKKEIDRLCK